MCAAFMAIARRIHGDLDANFTMDLAQNTGIAMDAAQNRHPVVRPRRASPQRTPQFAPSHASANSRIRFLNRLIPSQKFIV